MRVKEYFGRIRTFRTFGEDESERALWPILVAWFRRAEPLLPNLQTLVVYFEDDFQPAFQYLTFMVPPRLEHIAMVDMKSFGYSITFYQLLLFQGCSPTTVEYSGDVRLPLTINLLENLHTLMVFGPYERARHSSPFSLLELLNQFPSLKYLDIDIGTLRIQTPDPLDPFEHPALETLRLQWMTEELQPLLSFPIICPLVKTFSLKIRFNANLTWKFLLEKVIAILPNLEDLTLQVLESTGAPQLVLSDLHKLLLQPMESLVIEDIPNNLSLKDLQQLFSTWPNLHTLTLTGGKTPFDAKILLSTFTYQNLCTLHLPWDFIPLTSALTYPPAAQKNPLNYIHAAVPTRFPSALAEKVMLAQNILTLLPGLEAVTMDDELVAEAEDLQVIIKGMEAVAVARSI